MRNQRESFIKTHMVRVRHIKLRVTLTPEEVMMLREEKKGEESKMTGR